MREFLKKYDIFNWVMAVVASVLLWMYVTNIDTSDITKNYQVPLQVVGQNTLSTLDFNIINTLPEKVTIKARGPRDNINQLTNDKITARLNLGSIYQAGDYKLSYDVSFEVDSISVEQKSPSQITVAVDRIVTESIPVEVDFTGKLPQDFNMESYWLSVSEVNVTGPERYVDEIDRAAVKIDRAGLHELQAVEGDIVLYDSDGKVYTHEQVSQDETTTVFTASMEKHKTITLTANKIISDSMITEDMVNIKIAPETIEIWGDKEAVDAVNEINIGDISVVKCIETGVFEYVLPVQLPDGVNADVTDLAVTATVELTGIEQITVNIPAENLPTIEGYENMTEGIDVVLYAKTEDVGNITVESFRVFPTYSQDEFDAGTLTQVEMNVVCEDFDVIILGEYKVEVSKIVE